MLRSIVGVVLSALLLILAFPQTAWWLFAWVGFVPLFFLIDAKKPWAAFGWSVLCGYLFFFGTLGWLIYVSYASLLLLLYLALYFALFGAAFKLFQPWPLGWRLIVLPSVWVVLEYARGHLFTGFDWAMLAQSQAKNIWLIQISDLTGAYGISFLVMLVNILVFESCKFLLVRGRKGRGSKELSQLRQAQWAVGGIIVVALAYGIGEIAVAPHWPTVAVGVVQPNIPQAIKWDPHLEIWIVQKTIGLTQQLEGSGANLVVWPETSLPGIMDEQPDLVKAVKMESVKLKTPLLMGTITDDGERYYNSAYEIAGGRVANRYDKIHLVPFGEYFPMRKIFGWIYKYIGFDDFTPGRSYTIMHTTQGAPFSVLVCFEDTLSYLRRNFANAGASFFVNMTNDAWFLDTKAPFIHLDAAILGCAENKRSLVRAANTGYSGFIDPFGHIIASVENGQHKKTFISGTACARIPVVTAKTFYTKYGDVFTALCLFAILGAVMIRRRYA